MFLTTAARERQAAREERKRAAEGAADIGGAPGCMTAVRERLARARSVCVLTGSGISSESGLPTFRGVNGLWRNRRVEELASPHGFARDPRDRLGDAVQPLV